MGGRWSPQAALLPSHSLGRLGGDVLSHSHFTDGKVEAQRQCDFPNAHSKGQWGKDVPTAFLWAFNLSQGSLGSGDQPWHPGSSLFPAL